VFLGGRPEVDASKIGVAGFCMGGGFATLYAVRAPVGVAASFYGDVPASADELRGICPVVGGYGGQDRMFVDQGRRLASLLDELGVPNDVKIYEDAGHSFMSRHEGLLASILAKVGPMTVGYDPAAADDSWERMFRFFGEHLESAQRLESAD
jgi:carboxymethylenebutenolidase